MKLAFTKMQGAGNDFVVLDGVTQALTLSQQQLRFLADRRFGIGADQILLVEPPASPDVDFRYRIFNADGGEVEQCGNGARCFARFVLDRGLTVKKAIRVLTQSGVIQPHVLPDGSVQVQMGAARLAPADCHFDASGLTPQPISQAVQYRVPPSPPLPERLRAHMLQAQAPAHDLLIQLVSMGNPHAVCLVDNVDTAPVSTIGPWLEGHPRFAQGVNVGFLQILNRHHARLRVWERGVGETLACGTGACAAAVAGILQDKLDTPVTLDVRGGTLRIDWDGRATRHAEVSLSGPAVTVFQGQIELP